MNSSKAGKMHFSFITFDAVSTVFSFFTSIAVTLPLSLILFAYVNKKVHSDSKLASFAKKSV